MNTHHKDTYLAWMRRIAPTLLTSLLALILIVGLGVVLLTAYYGLPVGDDFYAIKEFSDKRGWLDSALFALFDTSRYSQSLASSISYGLFENKIGIILPVITIGWIFILFYLYVKFFDKRRNILNNYATLGLSAFLTFFTIYANLVLSLDQTWFSYQSIYFSSAIVTHTMPVLLLATTLYLILRYRPNKPKLLIVFLIGASVFAISFFNETLPATVFGLSLLTLLVTLFSSKVRHWRWLVLTVGIPSLTALIVMYLSPSSIQRRAGTTAGESYSILSALIDKFPYALASYFNPVDIILAASCGYLLFLAIKSKNKTLSWRYCRNLSIIACVLMLCFTLALLTAVTLLIAGYGPHTAVLARTLFMPQILYTVSLVLMSVAVFTVAYRSAPSRMRPVAVHVASVVMLICLMIASPHILDKITGQLESVVSYRNAWLINDAQLREHSSIDPNGTIYLPDSSAGIGDGYSLKCAGPHVNSTIWLTDVMEKYYGVREICAESDRMHQ